MGPPLEDRGFPLITNFAFLVQDSILQVWGSIWLVSGIPRSDCWCDFEDKFAKGLARSNISTVPWTCEFTEIGMIRIDRCFPLASDTKNCGLLFDDLHKFKQSDGTSKINIHYIPTAYALQAISLSSFLSPRKRYKSQSEGCR